MQTAARFARRLFGRRAPEPEVLVVSYPKCGRTWLRALVGCCLCRQFDLPEADLFKTLALSSAAGVKPTQFVHDGSGGVAGIPWNEQERDKSRFAAVGVALLVRDPRDVVVSSYFQASRRMHAFSGSLPEFVRDPCFGIRSIAAAFAAWDAARRVPRDFLLLRYEELQRDPEAGLRALLALMGLGEPQDAAVAAAVEFGAFENMRRLESSGGLPRKLRPGDFGDPESFKVRRGKIGGYVDYLGPDDIAYIEDVLHENGHPFGYGAAAEGGLAGC
jgi:hypothetical protein